MNCSIYFFGELGQGYTQSPDDGTRNLLETFFAKGQKGSRLSFVHEGKLAYYGYTRPLKAQGTYFGICCVFNDVFCDDYKSLFSLFEEAITYLVVEGKVLGFDESGDVVPVVERLYQASAEISRASDCIMAQLQRMESAFVKLPPVNYATASAATRVYSLDDNQWSIVEDMEKYPRVEVTKDSDVDSHALTSYSGRLNSLHSKVVQLEEELDKVTKQKKRTTLVVILMLVLVLAGLALYYVLVESNKRQEAIKSLSVKVDDLESEKQNLVTDLNRAKDSLEVIQTGFQDLSNQYEQLRGIYDSLSEIPFVTGANHLYSRDSSYDRQWALWLYASVPTQIYSFYVKSSKSGSLTFGLYDAEGNVIDTILSNVRENEFVRIRPSEFKIEQKGYYYLAIHSNKDDVGLSYHSDEDFSVYQGALRVEGSSSKGKSSSEIGKKFYQYFYDIEYKIREFK